jgi:hypothetical protein
LTSIPPSRNGPVVPRAAPDPDVPASDPEHAWLYRLGAAGALVTVLLIPVAVVAHLLWPPPPWAPGAAAEWFAYLRAHPAAGLLNLDLAMAVGLVAGVPLYLALYAVLRPVGPDRVLVTTVSALTATLLHLLAIAPLEVAAFGRAHTAATTELARAVYLAAGEVALSAYYGTVFHASYVLGYAAYVGVGLLMLRSAVFGRGTAYLAVATGALGFGFYLPVVGTLASVLVVLLIGTWNLVVARRLFALARRGGPE